MLRRLLSGLVITSLLAATAQARYRDDDPAGKLREWCERPLKLASLNLHRDPVDKLTEDLRRQLDRMKVVGAKAHIALEGDKVTILVTYSYPRPKRAIVGSMVVNGVVVQRTERVEYGWRVYVSARKGRLVTDWSGPVREDFSY